MSKNPPKPNTSPDHVKETAEAFTCPSHIEAREKIEAAIAAEIEAASTYGYPEPVDVEVSISHLRTLLDTPTQEGVGREEIARAIDDADKDWGYSIQLTSLVDGVSTYTLKMPGFEPTTHGSHGEAFDVMAAERDKRRADAILSLLPAPKLGEGAPCPYCSGTREWPTGYVCAVCEAKPQQPAPGAPEGWRDGVALLTSLKTGYSGPHDGHWYHVHAHTLNRLVQAAALTSSSAKLGG